jgi:superfamily I DNA/RNA helicase
VLLEGDLNPPGYKNPAGFGTFEKARMFYPFNIATIGILCNSQAEQQRIFSFVQHESGHGIIDAVAGSGKTTTIMECAGYVPDKSDILFCAFNNSIANEIRRKFHQRGINEVTVKTIHSLGLQILKDNNSTGLDITLNDHKYQQILKDEEMTGVNGTKFQTDTGN